MFLLVRVTLVAEVTQIMRSKEFRRLCNSAKMIIEVKQIDPIDPINNLLVFSGRRFKNLAVGSEEIMHRNAVLRR